MHDSICPEGTNLEIFSSKALKDSYKINQVVKILSMLLII